MVLSTILLSFVALAIGLFAGYKFASLAYRHREEEFVRNYQVKPIGMSNPEALKIEENIWHEAERDFIFRLHQQLSNA